VITQLLQKHAPYLSGCIAWHTTKHDLEFGKLTKILDSKGNKLLKNIKTRWISMLSPCKRIFTKYTLLVVKMVEGSDHIENEKNNFELLCDVETLRGLAYISPCLETMQRLLKFAQG
jgi:hypothetical protein